MTEEEVSRQGAKTPRGIALSHSRLGILLAMALLLPLTLARCVVDEKCYSDADCPSSEICKEGNCIDKECNIDADCGPGAVCRKGQCVLVCGGSECPSVPHADPTCGGGRCTYLCHAGWFDNNRLASDGCEASQCAPAEEICDGRDNNCDCPGDTNGDAVLCGPGDEGVDEGFDKTQAESCGPFCCKCEYRNADSLCVEAECRMGECAPGWYDVNENDADGCECPQPSSSTEICDGIDNNCDGCVDEGGVCGIDCSCDMVPVGSESCIDRYEASRPDATGVDAGADESLATSRAGVLPWMVSPMSAAHLRSFQAACEAAGKHLCTPEEWSAACTGPAPGTTYVFGDTFDPEVCNCVDTFCDNFCEESGIPLERCNTSTNCGYQYQCFRAVPTGVFTACTNAYGTLDINGNAWEIVPSAADPRGYEIRGGAFNCASAATRLRCSYNANWDDLYAGFRCCDTQ